MAKRENIDSLSMYMYQALRISLVIPVYNETRSIAAVIKTINEQSYPPNEVIFVDGGSSDNTVALIKQLTVNEPAFKVIEAGRAMPGKGRNIGAAAAKFEWIAFTDAGMTLDAEWLKELVTVATAQPLTDVVYGNYSPVIKTLLNQISLFAFVPPLKKNSIRGKSVASILLKKKVWEDSGGFPDFRAAEDLIFMEKIEANGAVINYAPKAMIYWQLRPTLISTFKKFALYSQHNVWAGRQWDWHYGIFKQYLAVLPFLFLAIFHSSWWTLVILLWMLARTMKRMLAHKYETGIKKIVNPLLIVATLFLILIIDFATLTGWIGAYVKRRD